MGCEGAKSKGSHIFLTPNPPYSRHIRLFSPEVVCPFVVLPPATGGAPHTPRIIAAHAQDRARAQLESYGDREEIESEMFAVFTHIVRTGNLSIGRSQGDAGKSQPASLYTGALWGGFTV